MLSILSSESFANRLRPFLPRGVDLQEVIVTTWMKARSQKPISANLTEWLLRIARNAALDAARANQRRRRHEVNNTDLIGNDDRESDADGCVLIEPAIDCDPADAAEGRELRRLLKTAVRKARVQREHRCALWAWMRDRLKEWAIRNAVPYSTARVWARRAREALCPHLAHARGPEV